MYDLHDLWILPKGSGSDPENKGKLRQCSNVDNFCQDRKYIVVTTLPL